MTTKKSSGKKEESSSTEESKVPAWSRDLIAKIITISVFILTAFITVYLLAFTEDKNASIDFIGKSLLPLWGTWLGTVLAFYFGKANFEAASNAFKRVSPESSQKGNRLYCRMP
jgi:ascorbate-specific PTS system EIIC-type component UlaA